jgi:hypothetical protein
MSKLTLIINDICSVGFYSIVWVNVGFKKDILWMVIITIAVFAACLVRHLDYYKLNKKIY